MPTHIISWSGGPDSTYGLLQFLRDTDDPVVAVCIGPPVDPKYVQASMRATRRLEGLLKERERDFRVVRYSLVAENRVAEPSDEISVLGMITAMFFDDPILYWFCCAEDDSSNGWLTTHKEKNERHKLMTRDVVRTEIVNMDVGKARIRRELGDLWDLTWSCLYPSEDLKPCRRCDKCKERRRAEAIARTYREQA